MQEYFARMDIGNLFLVMLKSSGVSLEVFFLTLLFSIPLALLICMGRMSKFKLISKLTSFLLLVIRGTPLMLQLIFVYFAPPYVFGVGMQRFTAAMLFCGDLPRRHSGNSSRAVRGFDCIGVHTLSDFL